MSKEKEMAVIGGMVTELAEVKRRVTALEEQARQYGRELEQIWKALTNIRFGSLEIDTSSMPTSDLITELLTELREARERRAELQTSLQNLGL